MSTLPLRDQIEQLRDALLHGLIEREVPVRLALLAALCGEHVLLVGPPGTAKSEIARRLRHAFKDASFFERLLTRFSVPEELFGPLSIKGLENDKYERQIEGYLPTAHVAFIDEIFKANSAILNALLTLLNERRFDQGATQIDTPLICAIGASNEYPEGDELEALYDRFLLRYHVEPVSDDAFTSLLELNNETLVVDNNLKLSAKEICAIQSSAHDVQIPESIKAKLAELRAYLNSDKARRKVKDVPEDHPARNFYISDRRWRKIIKLLKISAHTNGRSQVNDLDLLILIEATWNLPQQRNVVREWILNSMGAEKIDMPSSITKIISIYSAKCKQFESNTEQEKDSKGNPIYLGDSNHKITGVIGQPPPTKHKKNSQGHFLYHSPPSNYNQKSFQEKEITSSQIEEIARHNQYRHGTTIFNEGEWHSVSDYKKQYPIEEACHPSLVQVMASKAQIQHMCNELKKASFEATSERSKIQEKLDNVRQNFRQHLWLHDNSFVEKTSINMKEHIALLNKLEKDIEALVKRLERVPQEEP